MEGREEDPMDLEDLLLPYRGYKPSVDELVRTTARLRARRAERGGQRPSPDSLELDDWGRTLTA
jgi:hypothetical protein